MVAAGQDHCGTKLRDPTRSAQRSPVDIDPRRHNPLYATCKQSYGYSCECGRGPFWNPHGRDEPGDTIHPMRLLQRYILSELLKVYVFVLSVLTVLLVFVGVFREAQESGLGPLQILEILPFVVPS